jgi:hypothetical protein
MSVARELLPLGVPEGGVLVQGHLGVERVHLPSVVRMSGLISARSQSPSTKQW